MNAPQSWFYERFDDGIGRLRFDNPAGPNTLSRARLLELEQRLTEIASDPPRGLIVESGQNDFIVGADVSEFADIPDAPSARAYIEWAQSVLSRIEALSCPSVAVVRGNCLGGGMELALACRYRIACDDARTRLGLPEVLLGIFPGFGGSMRSMRTVGPLAAFDLMLTGRGLRARAAARIGLVDYAVPERQLENTARFLFDQLPRAHRPGWKARVLRSAPLRPLVAALVRRQVSSRAREEHYPAPYRLIEHWRVNAGSESLMLDGEAASVSDLVVTPTARNLVRAFFLQERLKGLGKQTDWRARHVHVIGGGVMGGDIAAWCAMRGLRVSLQDRGAEHLRTAMQRAGSLFAKRLRVDYERTAAWDRLIPDIAGNGVAHADVVIEAIFENAEAKRDLYRALQPKLRPDAVLATNTSSIPLDELNTALDDPTRLVGLHFFNPVAKMQLVEIVAADATNPDVAQRAAAFARQIGKLPLPVKSLPGFLVNRVLTPYLLEAVELANEGLEIEVIDEAALAFGMPMGPVELADTVGLDICLSVTKNLAPFLGFEIPEVLRKKVEAGELGRKTGRGFYQWKGDRPQKSRVRHPAPDDAAQRLVLRYVRETQAALRDGVVADADLADAGMIFGTGFAPFRGGPLRYAGDVGEDTIREQLTDLAARHGERFAPV
ncbi:MAG: enoyl-CoA hydratase/isomerase family protein [Chromatiales bacterium]|nr:enoyl-CoA hydratase/isomerase family protein [Chromatiales bacterium]